MTPLRAAIVGLGGIALEHFRKLERIEGVEVAGVCDRSDTLVEAVLDRFGGGLGFTDYAEMLEAVRPDAVHVLTPPQSHRELVGAALRAGAHVFVEKPIAPTFAEYAEMRDDAAARGLLLVENFNYRFMDVSVRALELVRAGEIGELVALDTGLSVGVADPSGPYRDEDVPHFAHDLPGGALRNFASHPASFVAAFAGDFRAVTVAELELTPSLPAADELRALVAGERVTSTITITGNARPGGMWLRLLGTGGEIEVDVLGRRLHLERGGSPLSRLASGVRHGAGYLAGTGKLLGRAVTSRQDYFEGFDRLLRGFYAAAGGDAPAPVPVEEMDVANRLVEELFQPGNRL